MQATSKCRPSEWASATCTQPVRVTGPDEWNKPSDIALSPDGTSFAFADTGNYRIKVWLRAMCTLPDCVPGPQLLALVSCISACLLAGCARTLRHLQLTAAQHRSSQSERANRLDLIMSCPRLTRGWHGSRSRHLTAVAGYRAVPRPACPQVTDLEGNTRFTFGSQGTTPGTLKNPVSRTPARISP